ncbi:hypothetical protein D1614_15740 [Maribellus luteus]|uniref:Uncharacterized protein n=1 Tax=Maribellus luteus TaxID=2305463 RepID=A0A399SUY4_9BACT|nr:hypothetical protein [Maribellus luteus]RIJ47208.1 hypothetical protein D1614_15740 [Maribellus luteus]
MKTILLITTLVVLLSCFTSCNYDSYLLPQNEELLASSEMLQTNETGLKSAEILPGSMCEPVWIPLLHKDQLEVGAMILSNSQSQLFIELKGNDQFEIESIQLWAGNKFSLLPANKNDQPLPGQFPYKMAKQDAYHLIIDQNMIGPNYYFPEGKKLYIIAHAEAIDKQTGEKKSAWSCGQLLNTKSGASYTEYYPCIPTGGGGCFPHLAFCGPESNGNYYFDNTLEENTQHITADNEELIGSVRYEEGKIIFNFSQDWSFFGNTPIASLFGCDTPGGELTELESGPLEQLYDDFYITSAYYPYYVIQLNVQYCTTSN